MVQLPAMLDDPLAGPGSWKSCSTSRLHLGCNTCMENTAWNFVRGGNVGHYIASTDEMQTCSTTSTSTKDSSSRSPAHCHIAGVLPFLPCEVLPKSRGDVILILAGLHHRLHKDNLSARLI